MTKTPICTMECEDCGKFAVLKSEHISIFIIDDECYGISRCTYCDLVKTDAIDKTIIPHFQKKGVKIFSWNTGEEVIAENSNG